MYRCAQILLNSEGEQPKSVKKLDTFHRKKHFLHFLLFHANHAMISSMIFVSRRSRKSRRSTLAIACVWPSGNGSCESFAMQPSRDLRDLRETDSFLARFA